MKSRHYLFLMIGLLFSAIPVLCQTKTEDGIAFYRASKYDDAVTTLKSVTDTDKKNRFAWVYLGASLVKGGRGKEAAAAFRKGKAKVEDLVPGDDSPVTSFFKPRPHYTDMARENLTAGIVRLAVELRADGKIGFIFPVDPLPNGLTEQSIAAARLISFTPAVKIGKPVTIVAILEYTFEIR